MLLVAGTDSYEAAMTAAAAAHDDDDDDDEPTNDKKPQLEPVPSTSITTDTEVISQTDATNTSNAECVAGTTPATLTAMPRHRATKRKPNAADDDSQLFNNWLSSEIEKNQTKIHLMKTQIDKNTAKKELIELLKIKTTQEIQTFTQSFFDSAAFHAEL